MVAGGMAGVACWTPIMPFDTLKSLLQADHTRQYSGMVDCALKLYRKCGIPGFFRGMTTLWVRAFPVNAVTFVFYAKTLEYLNNM